MSWAKDRKYIGKQRPFDYPQDIHFSNNHIMGNFNPRTYLVEDIENHPTFHGLGSNEDFSERVYESSRNYDIGTDFGAIITESTRNKMFPILLIIAGYFGYKLLQQNAKKS